jgi:hypothetical protein
VLRRHNAFHEARLGTGAMMTVRLSVAVSGAPAFLVTVWLSILLATTFADEDFPAADRIWPQ